MCMKTCTKCEITKPYEDYNKHKIMKDGYASVCKCCKKAQDKLAYEQNKEARLLKAKEYYHSNKQQILSKINRDEKSEYRKDYYVLNKHIEQAQKKVYNAIHKDSIAAKQKIYRKENRAKLNAYHVNKKKKDPLFKLSILLRKRVREIIKSNGFDKSQKYIDYIGCSPVQLKHHIESKFRDGMTWENHGSVWHIDHIIPISIAKTEHQVYELSHYTNLQPLLVKENLSKNDKITSCWQKFQRDKNIELDKAAGFPFDLDVKDFVLNVEDISDEHRDFIKKYEWLGTVGFGIKHCFTARWNNHLAGVVLMGEPNFRQFGDIELLIHRGAASSWSPKNLNSRLIMFGCNWIVRNTNYRIFTAYSDPDAGEIGTIYQACNFDYLGQTYGADYSYRLPNGKVVSSRYFNRTSSMKKWAKELNITWQDEWNKENGFQNYSKIPQVLKDYAQQMKDSCIKTKQSPKGKYVLLLNYGKNKIKRTWEKHPYPKR